MQLAHVVLCIHFSICQNRCVKSCNEVYLCLTLAVVRAAYFLFAHAGEANESLKQLPGTQEADSLGRAQKKLRLTSGKGFVRPVVLMRL